MAPNLPAWGHGLPFGVLILVHILIGAACRTSGWWSCFQVRPDVLKRVVHWHVGEGMEAGVFSEMSRIIGMLFQDGLTGSAYDDWIRC